MAALASDASGRFHGCGKLDRDAPSSIEKGQGQRSMGQAVLCENGLDSCFSYFYHAWVLFGSIQPLLLLLATQHVINFPSLHGLRSHCCCTKYATQVIMLRSTHSDGVRLPIFCAPRYIQTSDFCCVGPCLHIFHLAASQWSST